MSMLCGVLSSLGFVVTTILSNYYIGLTFPLLLYYMIVILNTWLPIPEMLKIERVYLAITAVDRYYSSLHYIIYGVLYTLCLLVVFYYIAKNRVQRRLEHA